MYFLKFNNMISEELNLKIIKRPNIPNPKKKIKEIPIIGGDGSVFEDEGGYENIIISVDFNFIYMRENINDLYRYIKSWLNNIKDNKLSFSNDLDYFYRVLNVTFDSFETIYKRKGMFTVIFTCSPYMFLESGDYFLNFDKKIILENIYEESNPIFYIEGNGEITLTVNNSISTVSVADYIYIDTEKELVYRNINSNLFNLINGDYPRLKIGTNNIEIAGNINVSKIKPRWRCL